MLDEKCEYWNTCYCPYYAHLLNPNVAHLPFGVFMRVAEYLELERQGVELVKEKEKEE